jgi:hypothetical protein
MEAKLEWKIVKVSSNKIMIQLKLERIMFLDFVHRLMFLKNYVSNKVQKNDSLKCNTPSSEPFRIQIKLVRMSMIFYCTILHFSNSKYNDS